MGKCRNDNIPITEIAVEKVEKFKQDLNEVNKLQ